MRFSTHLTAMFLICAGGVACSTTISGQQVEEFDPDANIPEVPPAPDAAVEIVPEPDAAPLQAAPCVEGDARVSGPDETCYMFFSTPLDWTSSQAACVALGATLITVLDADEQVFAGQLAVNAVTPPDVWMGATDEQLENSFVWVDGAPMIFDVWRLGEPNNSGPNGPENCAIIEGDNPALEWDDRDCATLLPYLCERPPPQ